MFWFLKEGFAWRFLADGLNVVALCEHESLKILVSELELLKKVHQNTNQGKL